ncbi:hypothetical protein XENOCAPTIV_021538, partial [Xenoophorus captivus]
FCDGSDDYHGDKAAEVSASFLTCQVSLWGPITNGLSPWLILIVFLQVSATLSLDLDRAEHLLIHCKWNVDLLVQRYTDDPDALIMAAGLRCRNPQPPPSPASTCPVCLGPRTGSMEPIPTLSCMHYCCRVRTTQN